MKLPDAAVAELRARYQNQATANLALASYLLGVLQALDINPDDYAGFDDVSGELMLKAAEDDSRMTPSSASTSAQPMR